jgi:DNA excision repair protein ERCC-4
VGDYIVSPTLGVERKALPDFFSSIYDGRLFDQCAVLARTFPTPVLLVEGELAGIEELTHNPRVAYGALASAALDTGVRILHSPSSEGSADLLYVLCRRATRSPELGKLLRKPAKSDDAELERLYVVASLPGVGETLARRMLQAFGSPRAVFRASVAELARVPGVGRARAARIVRVLTAINKPIPATRHFSLGAESDE